VGCGWAARRRGGRGVAAAWAAGGRASPAPFPGPQCAPVHPAEAQPVQKAPFGWILELTAAPRCAGQLVAGDAHAAGRLGVR
jgi:hypothetical protein